MKLKSKHRNETKKIPQTVKIIPAVFITGVIVGCITGYLMKSSLYSPLITIYNDILSRMNSLDINHSDIFFLSLRRNFKYFLLLYVFAITNLWSFYYSAFILYIGFSNGLLLAFNIILYGITGSVRYICYLFPQSVIFIPLYIVTITQCSYFHKRYYECTDTTKKGKLLLQQFPFFIAVLIILALGCITEAWLNLPLVLWYSATP